MHNYHTDDYYFHANGDPIPSDVLIRKCDDISGMPFRTTAEEIVTFCAARRLGASGTILMLRTTTFEISELNVILATLQAPNAWDASTIRVPMVDLQDFAAQALQRRFELYVEEAFNQDTSAMSDVMAGIGLFAHLRLTHKD